MIGIEESRARVCGYLYGWSSNATHLAFEHKWLEVQSALIPFEISADEEQRLNAALAPMRSRLLALYDPAIEAVTRGENPPLLPYGVFRQFYPLLKEAKIPQNESNESRVVLWLDNRGFREAVDAAFAKQ